MAWLGGNHHIQAGIWLLLALFWYIMGCKMVLDSVASNKVSFSENHAFYCFLVHEKSLTIDMQSFHLIQNNYALGVCCFLTGSSCYHFPIMDLHEVITNIYLKKCLRHARFQIKRSNGNDVRCIVPSWVLFVPLGNCE